MSLDLLLPYDIPVKPLHRLGYAASPSIATSLAESILPECKRDVCTFRGKLVPPITKTAVALHKAGQLARSKADVTGSSEWAFVFRLMIRGMIARPPRPIAARLTADEGAEIWDALRPFAEAGNFHGVQLPDGLVVFDAALDGCSVLEEFAWRVKSHGSSA